MFRNDPLAQKAKHVSDIAMDISELLMQLDLPEGPDKNLTVAYHAACSLQHGQQIKTYPKDLLKRAGFTVVEPADSHLCCGSAGTYNLMQPEISQKLKTRKIKTLEAFLEFSEEPQTHQRSFERTFRTFRHSSSFFQGLCRLVCGPFRHSIMLLASPTLRGAPLLTSCL